MADHATGDPPSPFIVEWATRIADQMPAACRALDVATGRGRHARLLAALGFRTFGVDRSVEILRHTVREAMSQGLTIRAWCADLAISPLPRSAFDLVVVARYLQRDLMGSIREAAAPTGVVLYETFTSNQLAFGVGPKSPDHLLEPGELRVSFQGFDILFYEEVLHPQALARIVARRRVSD